MRAKKSLGQNFLTSSSAIMTMLNVAGITPGMTVIEVGPGKGVLTEALLKSGAHVIAFELDPRMIEYLNETYSTYVTSGHLTLIHQDILEADIDTYVAGNPYRVVANIPYYITNAIIRLFLSHNHQPEVMCLLVQKEVAERIARDEKESILSLSVKAYGIPRFVAKVPRRYFSPAPRVDSAILLISDISRKHFTSSEHEHRFFDIVKRGFMHKRKYLVSNLSSSTEDKPIWEDKLTTLGYKSDVRAEDIPLSDWLLLSAPL